MNIIISYLTKVIINDLERERTRFIWEMTVFIEAENHYQNRLINIYVNLRRKLIIYISCFFFLYYGKKERKRKMNDF